MECHESYSNRVESESRMHDEERSPGQTVVLDRAAHQTHTHSRILIRAIGAVCGIGLSAFLVFASRFQQIQPQTRGVMAVLGLAVVFWTFRVFENHIVALLMFALLLLIRVPPAVVFSGFAVSTFWVLLVALYFCYVMRKTGLAQRIGLGMLRLFKPSYASVVFAFFLIGGILSLGIASFTVRVAIMVPLAWSVVQGARLPERSVASALIVISAFEMALLPGFATLTGSIAALQFVPLFHELRLPMAWLDYGKAAAVPAVVCSLLVLAGNLLMMRPELPLDGSGWAQEGKAARGRLTRDEILTLFIISAAVVFWATQRWHGIDEGSVALSALVALLATGVIKPSDFENGISWGLVIFIGSSLTMVKVIPTYGVGKLVGIAVVDKLGGYLVNPTAALLIVPLVFFAFRMFEPAGSPSSIVLFLALYHPLMNLGISHLVFAVIILLAFVPFWFSYQNLWIMMTDGMTERSAFTRGQQAKMATIYGAAVILSVLVSIVYWRAIGLIATVR